MHARYITSVLAGLAGGFVVVASQAFASGTTAWLAFALGVGMVVLAPVPVLFGERKVTGLALDGLSAVFGAWTIVASLIFTGDTVRWLSFSEAAGFVALAVAGLTLNQVRLARQAHVATTVPATTLLATTAPATLPQGAESVRPAAVAA
jgi:uncharacterized membrane protein